MKSSINPGTGIRKASLGSAFNESVQDSYEKCKTLYSDRDFDQESSSPHKNAVMEVNA